MKRRNLITCVTAGALALVTKRKAHAVPYPSPWNNFERAKLVLGLINRNEDGDGDIQPVDDDKFERTAKKVYESYTTQYVRENRLDDYLVAEGEENAGQLIPWADLTNGQKGRHLTMFLKGFLKEVRVGWAARQVTAAAAIAAEEAAAEADLGTGD